MRNIFKILILFICGGACYTGIEVVYRAIMQRPPTHWSMFIVGGIAFLLVGAINEFLDFNMPLIKQGIIGTGLVLMVEYCAGVILNIHLGLNIWDYSNLAFNLHGQICLLFALLWFPLVIIAIVIDDFLRWNFFDEKKPSYTLFTRSG